MDKYFNVRETRVQKNTQERTISAREHVQYNIDEARDLHLTHYRFICKQSSYLELQILLKEKSSFALCIEIILEEPNAQAHIIGSIALSGNGKCIVEIKQIHNASRTISSSMFKAVLTDEATLDYQGIIYVHELARGTDAQLYNKNMVLSADANVRSIPSLEVLTDDVQCKHGTATAQYNKEQLFYMQSRGINQIDAQKLLLNAFFLPEMCDMQQELDYLLGDIIS